MSWADVTYALWAVAALGFFVLWLAARRASKLGRARIGRPSVLVRDMLDDRTWLRMLVVLAWVWLGVHAFAR